MVDRTDTPIAQDLLQRTIQLERIFMPNARARRDALYDGQKPARFVHYTSAEAALNIIRTKRVWMRNTTCMSDYMEVEHGFQLLNRFFHEERKRAQFTGALDACHAGVGTEAIGLFNQWWNDIKLNTYVTSLSEHMDTEDTHGRLSMWRAFGGNTARVALVFNVPWFTGAQTALNISFSPVTYPTADDVEAEIASVIKNVRENASFLHAADRQLLLNYTFHMLVTGVTCLKHEGFKEEREWRVIHAPNRAPSSLMEVATETVGGIPQIVYKIPFDKRASNALAGLDFEAIFDKVIIGPSQYPWAISQAFVGELTAAGIQDAATRVNVSGIPIRA